VNVIKAFANQESLKGDKPIATPTPTETSIFIIKYVLRINKNYGNTDFQ